MATFTVDQKMSLDELMILKNKKFQEFLKNQQALGNHVVIYNTPTLRDWTTNAATCVNEMNMIVERVIQLLEAKIKTQVN